MAATDKDHIKQVGEVVYNRAFVAALIEVRKDRRLIGLDKFRFALAREAALRATGLPRRPLILHHTLGRNDQQTQHVAEEILENAICAAQAVNKVVT